LHDLADELAAPADSVPNEETVARPSRPIASRATRTICRAALAAEALARRSVIPRSSSRNRLLSNSSRGDHDWPTDPESRAILA
jgi:hypothetical protein